MAIADVCGKGVEAAAVTALARHTLRAAALHHAAAARRCSRRSTTRCRTSTQRSGWLSRNAAPHIKHS